MKPLGLKPFHHKIDWRLHENHRKVDNWWQAEQEPNKTAAKREAKLQIDRDIQDMESE